MQLGKRFQGKVCLVTGGGSGIGRSTCLRLAYEGGKVLVVDVEDSGDGTASRICESGGAAGFFGRMSGSPRRCRRRCRPLSAAGAGLTCW